MRVVSDGVMTDGVYDSLARHRAARTWWQRDRRGVMLDVGPALAGRERFEQGSLARTGRICAWLRSGGVRELVHVGDAWEREFSHPDGHYLLSDYAGGLSIASDMSCLLVCRSRDRFECLDCAKAYVVRGHVLAVCRTPERHGGCRALEVELAGCAIGSGAFWNAEVKTGERSASGLIAGHREAGRPERRESTRCGGARA